MPGSLRALTACLLALIPGALAACDFQGSSQRPPEPSSVSPAPLLPPPAPVLAAPPLLSLAPSPDARSGKAIFDPALLSMVLDDARLVAVRDAAAREAYVTAAQELDAAFTRETPAPEDARLWKFQLGRLRDLGGDPLGAARAFDEAAATAWPLADHARFRAAQILAKADQDDDALSRARAVGRDIAVAPQLELVIAEALAGKGDIDGAAVAWRSYLGRSRHPFDWLTITLRFARALLAHPSEVRAEEAVALARRVIFEGPRGDGASEAKKIEADALAILPFAKRKSLETPSSAELLARADSLLDAQQLREAVRVSDALVALPEADRPGELACEAWLVRAEALSKLRKRPESSDAYAKAADRCKGLPSRVKALFAGGREAHRAGRVPEAVARYAELERAFPTHSYADDARLLGARAALVTGDRARFVAMLSRIADDYPNGDMVADGLFELALSSMNERDWSGAVAPLERALSVAPRERAYHAAGRLPYYLGRARLEMGATEAGMEQLVSVIRDYPLSFYMALAYARVAERDPRLAEQTLEAALAGEAEGASDAVQSADFLRPEFIRAAMLVQVGETKLAKAELDRLGVGARTASPEVLWASALLLARAGDVAQSHRLFRGAQTAPSPDQVELVDWSSHYPAGKWRSAWEIAFPRPFGPIVAAQTARSGIPAALAYAIMREESAFDPRVVSPAAAVGLMQLIVPTAQRMAKPLALPSDAHSLKRPEVNVALGCRYLSILRAQFGDNPLLAIPGYNAGGGAPKKWVAERPSDDFDLWVERIPYEETRLYTKRVIGTMAAYGVLYARDEPNEALRAPLAVSPQARAVTATAKAEGD